jgi:hypothetical protein
LIAKHTLLREEVADLREVVVRVDLTVDHTLKTRLHKVRNDAAHRLERRHEPAVAEPGHFGVSDAGLTGLSSRPPTMGSGPGSELEQQRRWRNEAQRLEAVEARNAWITGAPRTARGGTVSEVRASQVRTEIRNGVAATARDRMAALHERVQARKEHRDAALLAKINSQARASLGVGKASVSGWRDEEAGDRKNGNGATVAAAAERQRATQMAAQYLPDGDWGGGEGGGGEGVGSGPGTREPSAALDAANNGRGGHKESAKNENNSRGAGASESGRRGGGSGGEGGGGEGSGRGGGSGGGSGGGGGRGGREDVGRVWTLTPDAFGHDGATDVQGAEASNPGSSNPNPKP